MENLVIKHFEERLREGEYLSYRNPEIHGLKGNVLEVGCGAVSTCSSENCELVGIDICRSMAKKFKVCNNAEAIRGDARFLPFQPNTFSTLISVNLLHHLVANTSSESKNNIEKALREFRLVLKKDGCIRISEDIALNDFFTKVMYFFTMLCAKVNIQIKILDVENQVITFFMSETEYNEMFRRLNLALVDQTEIPWKVRRVLVGKVVWFILKRV